MRKRIAAAAMRTIIEKCLISKFGIQAPSSSVAGNHESEGPQAHFVFQPRITINLNACSALSKVPVAYFVRVSQADSRLLCIGCLALRKVASNPSAHRDVASAVQCSAVQ